MIKIKGAPLKFELRDFPTHIQISRNKWVKISGNSIYSGNMNRFTRAKVIEAIHNWLVPRVEENISNNLCSYTVEDFLEGKISMECHYYIPRNWGTIRMLRGKISWKPYSEEYKANFDIGNLSWIWNKAILDCIVRLGYIPDDNVDHVISSGGDKFIEVENLEDRKIVVIIRNNL